ncbi:hypothetical protein DUK53_08655 [Listeria sp. SHR_NRA_18]|uniref:hypothetical protein n=1 Tax=Listeria TaxID=1637 RepID=UPI00051CC547|nr:MULTISPECIES: hypothetical protein [Listeria]KGL46036.1 hypothetical protein EP56_02880 [Listeriaceae bacterium FSL A5-0209]RQW66698.1 hypothetical protein DUK53_08655 [Listeria sp. SHR_NRA_18]
MAETLANCDGCRKDFKIKYIKTTRKPDIQIMYFKCKYCKKIYISSATDADMRKEQVEIKMMMREANQLAANTAIPDWQIKNKWDHIESKKQRLTFRIKTLGNRYKEELR